MEQNIARFNFHNFRPSDFFHPMADNLLERYFILIRWYLLSWLRNSPDIVDPKGLLQCVREPALVPYPEQVESIKQLPPHAFKIHFHIAFSYLFMSPCSYKYYSLQMLYA
jgi:hypothetical protein